MKQTISGKAFEFAIATQISQLLRADILKTSALEVAENAFLEHSEKQKEDFSNAAYEAVSCLIAHDNRFEDCKVIRLQKDSSGQIGDVRDIILEINKGEIGISAKNNHRAIKHSRLSDKIDFGKKWADYPCSSHYMKKIQPIFSELRELKKKKILFSNLKGKEQKFYLPVLLAFEEEFKRLCEDYRDRFVKRVFQYLLGKYDFYKVVNDSKNKQVYIQSVNINGSLKWGKSWKIPTKIDMIKRKEESNNTTLIFFSGGYQLSFRIHNASSKVEPSLKFDINFTALPPDVLVHYIPLV